MVEFIPRKGDFVWLNFDPQAGQEQKGRRPALVMSNEQFNRHTGMAIVCPITNTNRRFPFHLAVSRNCSLTGFVMVEQTKSIDYVQRQATYIESASTEYVLRVQAVLDACL